MLNILKLPSQIYDNISKIFNFYEIGFEKNKIKLIEDKNKKIMVLSLKIPVGFEEVESNIKLKEMKIANEEIIKILFDEIRQLKINGNNINVINNKDEKKLEEKINLLLEENKKNNLIAEKEKKESEKKINSLIKKNEELEAKINLLIKKNKESDSKINSLIKINEGMGSKITILIDDNKNMKNIIDKYIDILDKKRKEENEGKKEKEIKE